MKTATQVNRWMGYSGAYVQVPNENNRRRVIRAKRSSCCDWTLTSLNGEVRVPTGTTLEHGERIESITLE